jgi:ATP-dependent RNA helicase DDX24/MAK5
LETATKTYISEAVANIMAKSNKRKAAAVPHASASDQTPKFDKKARKRQRVALDQLRWKPVEAPEGLDDYEGFFGLEEVEDVQVIKQDGLVTFQAPDEAIQEEDSKKAQEANDAGLGGEDEWEGFSSEDESDEQELDGQGGQDDQDDHQDQDDPPSAEDEDEHKDEDDDEDVANGNAMLESAAFSALEEETLDDGVDISQWDPLGLSPELLSSVSKMKFPKPTPIQSAAIPEILEGNDVIGKASTGSGKTLAYGLPIIESFLKDDRSNSSGKNVPLPATALIIAPTRELAHQISSHLTAVTTSGSFEGPRIATITGGLSVQKQERQLITADIIVCTPGRVWEVMSNSKSALTKLQPTKFLVLDEADRLLSDGHFKEVQEILSAIDRVDVNEDDDNNKGVEETPPPRQTLVFSATFQKGLQKKLGSKNHAGGELLNNQQSMEYLIKKLQFRQDKPKFIDVDPTSQLAKGIKEGLVECVAMEKVSGNRSHYCVVAVFFCLFSNDWQDLYLYTLLLLHARTRTLIFTNSISAVRRLTPYLQNLGLPAQSLHSSMIQKARLRAVERFSKAESAILIATDVAARGLDIPGVQLIVHYHLPRAADMYVHRSGRTARAHNIGASVILCAPEEVAGVRRLIARVHVKTGESKSNGIPTIDIDRRAASRLKPRATLAKKIADVGLAKEKGKSDDKFFREAAEELGVEYDSEELEMGGGGKRGRGNARKKQEREDRDVGKDQVAAWRAELKKMLSHRVNLGISERYIAQGVIDIDSLLRGDKGDFLGATRPLDMTNL